MTTTLTITAIFGLTLLIVWAYDRHKQNSRRRDRQIVRRIQNYLDQCPPRNPW